VLGHHGAKGTTWLGRWSIRWLLVSVSFGRIPGMEALNAISNAIILAKRLGEISKIIAEGEFKNVLVELGNRVNGA
jgi:hypothetical protein